MDIIFLDVDGVLNDDYSQRFDPHRIEIINRLTEETNFKVVITSTIRKHKVLLGKLKMLVNNIVGKTKNFSKNITHFQTLRVAEIIEYISSNNINKYLVIDDVYLLIENFYLVGDKGLQEKDFEIILKLLNN